MPLVDSKALGTGGIIAAVQLFLPAMDLLFEFDHGLAPMPSLFRDMHALNGCTGKGVIESMDWAAAAVGGQL